MPVLPTHDAQDPLPPFTARSLLETWRFDFWPTALVAVIAAIYIVGVVVLRRRGVAWSPWRVVCWLGGLVIVLIATSSAVGVYDDTLFSAHSVQHMLLQMLAPVLLVVAAPMTLALRTMPLRPRQGLLAITHSRPARFLAHPAVAFAIFGLSQFVVYYTPLYEASLRNDWIHNASHVHFVAVGFLFYWSLLAIDPVPHRPQHVLKFLLVVGMAPMHVLLGVPIMLSKRLFAGDYYLELGRTWGPSLLDDQRAGGAILWAFGDVSAILLIGAFLLVWSRADDREARRTDRQLDREFGDAPTIAPWWLEVTSAGAEQADSPARARPAAVSTSPDEVPRQTVRDDGWLP